MKYTALIVAAGSGSRMGLGYNKMLYQFDNGKTILETTVDIFLNDQRCEQVVVVGSEQDIEQYQKLLINERITFTIGGKTRQESVYHGLLKTTMPYVLIHDGARPWLSMDCINRLLECLKEHDIQIDYDNSYGYSDSNSDIPMLSLVQNKKRVLLKTGQIIDFKA